MDNHHWHKQTIDKPLFPNLLWSRPENRAYAGKLLIIGGNAHGFAAPAEAYAEAETAGIGSARVILPQSIKRVAGGALPAVEFAMHNPSGGFSQMALGLLLEQANWAEGVLLAGDFGRNSETAILLEKFLAKHTGQVTLTKDCVDYFTIAPDLILGRPDTNLVLSFAQLQKLATSAKFPKAFTFDMDFIRLVDQLNEFSKLHAPHFITKHLDTIFVAVNGEICTTKQTPDPEIWRVKTATHASVWWLQNPTAPFEALSASVLPISTEGETW